MKALLTMTTALILTCGVGFANPQGDKDSPGEKAGEATESAVASAGEGAEKGMKEAGKGVDKGLEATGKGVGEAVEHTAEGAATAGKATAKAMKKTGEAVSDFFTGDDAVQDKNKVMEAQRVLRNKGYYNGAIDGIIGPKTRNGLREYQGDSKLRVTGQLDEPTAEKLGVSD